jgi:hypothetical protein
VIYHREIKGRIRRKKAQKFPGGRGRAVSRHALPYQVPDFPPEVAGLAAGGVALGAGIIAEWRERRKAKDDADHRPEN